MTAAPGPVATGRLTRVTLVGPRHRIDLVLPSDEPMGVLLPELVAMVGYSPTGDPRAYQVSLLDGRVLEPNTNLRASGVTDGTLLRLDPLTDAPPAAILHDIPDEVADDLSRRRGRWAAGPRSWTATGTVMAGAALAAALTARALPAGVPIIMGAVVLAAGTVLGGLGVRAAGVATLLGGASILLVAASFWPMAWPAHWALAVLVTGISVLTLGITTGHQRAGVIAAATVLVLLGLWAGLFTLGASAAEASAVMGVISVGGLGILPRIAMMSSGLTKLDDRQSADEPVTRTAARAAVDSAHRGLALASVATAASGALAGWLLAQAGTGWTLIMAGLVAVALLLRLRAFPLTVEVVSMVAAALVILVGLILHWFWEMPALWWAAALCALAATVPGLVILGYEPARHVRAWGRQVTDRVEGLAVIALVPVAVGVFGLYTHLLHTF